METNEGPQGKPQASFAEAQVRVPVAEYYAKGRLAHLDDREQFAGRGESGEINVDSQEGAAIQNLLSEIDKARNEGHDKVGLKISQDDWNKAQKGFESLVALGPADARIQRELRGELMQEVRNERTRASIKTIGAKVRSFFSRFLN